MDKGVFEEGLVKDCEKGCKNKTDAQKVFCEAKAKQYSIPFLLTEKELDECFKKELRASFFQLFFSLEAP